MSRRTITFIGIFLLLGLIGLGIFLFSSLRAPVPAATTANNSLTNKFFPFGNSNEPTPPPIEEVDTSIPPTDTTPLVKLSLMKLTTVATAGFAPITTTRINNSSAPLATTSATSTIAGDPFQVPSSTSSLTVSPATFTVALPTIIVNGIRYIERENGNISDIFTDDPTPLRLTNTTIPRVHDALFSLDANAVLLRYLGDDGITIQTFAGTIPPKIENVVVPEPPKALIGSFFPINISDLSRSPNGDRVFYLENVTDGSTGTTANFANNVKNFVFTSPLREWKTTWISEKSILFTTKPSGTVPGYAYTLDTTTKAFVKTLGEIPGLVTLPSPEGKKILYSQSRGREISLGLYDLQTKGVTDLGLRTLAEKCVWANEEVVYCAIPNTLEPRTYPDAWYQGTMSFSDSVWQLNLSTSEYKLLINPETINQFMDVTTPALSPDKTYFYFINKKDAAVWALHLEN